MVIVCSFVLSGLTLTGNRCILEYGPFGGSGSTGFNYSNAVAENMTITALRATFGVPLTR